METLREVLGLGMEPKDLGVLQVCVRGVIVFIAALVMVRVAHKRFMSHMTAFDTVLGFVLASALARAINGSAPFLPTLVVGFVLVFLHRLFSGLAYHSEKLGNLLKGHSNVLVQDGRPNEKAMRAHKITKNDLLEAARLRAEVGKVENIQTATLERNGQISVISKQS
jgi:uncharacterized membrane protein YcaP (DUF421 family)